MYNENLNIDKVYDSQPNINFETLSVFSGSALTINDIPSWLPKANFSRTQYDLVAISPNGEEIVLLIILQILNYLPFKPRMVYC